MATSQSVVNAFNAAVTSLAELEQVTNSAYGRAMNAKSKYGQVGNAPVATKMQKVVDAINAVSKLAGTLQDDLSIYREAVQALPEATDDEQITSAVDALVTVLGPAGPALVGQLTPARATARTSVANTAPELVETLSRAVNAAEAAQNAVGTLRTATTAYKATLITVVAE